MLTSVVRKIFDKNYRMVTQSYQLIMENKYEQALEIYNQILKKNPTYAVVWHNKAFICMRLEKYQEAMTYFTKALKLDPRFVPSHFCKAELLFTQGEYTEALKEFDAVLSIVLSPDRGHYYHRALNYKCIIFISRKKYNKALSYADKVLEINSNDFDALSNKAFIFTLQGKHQEADSFFKKALSIDPNNAAALSNKAFMLTKQGNYKQALRFYNKALAIKADLPSVWKHKSVTLMKMGKYREAINCFQQSFSQLKGVLNLRRTQTYYEHILFLVALLSVRSPIKRICLMYNNLTNREAKALLLLIKLNPNIIELNLNYNPEISSEINQEIIRQLELNNHQKQCTEDRLLNQELVYFVILGNVEELRKLHVSRRDFLRAVNNYSSLYMAIQLKHFPVINFLLKEAYQISVYDIEQYGSLEIALAIEARHFSLTDMFMTTQKHRQIIPFFNMRHYRLQENFSLISKYSLVGFFNTVTLHDILQRKNYFGRPLWVLAIKYNFNLLRPDNIDLCVIDQFGNNALHIIAQYDRIELWDLFVSKGLNPETKNYNGQTPFIIACQYGSVKIFKLLWQNGAKLFIPNKENLTAFDLIFMHGQANILRFIARENINIILSEKQLLHKATKYDQPSLIPILIKICHCHLHEKNKHNLTALLYATKVGSVRVLDELLQQGAAFITRDTFRNKQYIFSALQIAVANRHIKIIERLLAFKLCDVTLQSNDGKNETIFHTAVKFNSIKALAFLIGNSQLRYSGVNIPDSKGVYPCHIASQLGHCDMLHYLAMLGANLEVKDKDGYSALHYAIKASNSAEAREITNRLQVIELLLKLGVNIDRLATDLVDKRTSIYGLLGNAQSQRAHKQALPQTIMAKGGRKYRNLVLKGGGVKGIAYIGVLLKLITERPNFLNALVRVAGTSAGAITAFLLAIGYDAAGIKGAMQKIDFMKFMDSHHKAIITKITTAINEGGLTKVIRELLPLGELSKIETEIEKIEASSFQLIHDVKNWRAFSAAKNLWKTSVHVFNAYQSGLASFKQMQEFFTNVIKKIYESISTNFGLFPGESALALFEDLLEEADVGPRLSKTITFKQLHDRRLEELKEKGKTKLKDLYLIGTNLTKCRSEIFSWEHTPNMEIIKAVRISMSFPFFFQPYEYNGDLYIDGGVLMNYPLKIFDFVRYLSHADTETIYGDEHLPVHNPDTLGLCLVNKAQKELFEYKREDLASSEKIGNLISFIGSFISLYLNHEENSHYHQGVDRERTIYIDTMNVSTLDFNLDGRSKDILIQSGYCAVDDFLKREEKAPKKIYFSPRLCGFMMKHAVTASFRYTKRGGKFNNIKFNINTPEKVYKLYRLAELSNLVDLRSLPVNVNVRDAKGNGVLHYAFKKAFIEKDTEPVQQWRILKNLITAGVDLNTIDNDGSSVLDLILHLYQVEEQKSSSPIQAQANKYYKLMLSLVSNGARICKAWSYVHKVLLCFHETDLAEEFSGYHDAGDKKALDYHPT